VSIDCVYKLRSQDLTTCNTKLVVDFGEARVNYASANPANRSPILRLVIWSGHIGILANLTISH